MTFTLPRSLAMLAGAAALSLVTGAGAIDSAPMLTEGKIDAAVQAAIDSGQTVPVILLGRTQLFPQVGGLAAFEKQHAGDRRLDLRKQVVADLKRIAAAEQKRILAALDQPRVERSTWIVNAIVVTLSPDAIKRAATLADVAFVYPSNEQPGGVGASGNGMLILPKELRRPFSDVGKRIGWNVEKLGAPRVWHELHVDGTGVLVASIDVGVNYAHQDLRHALWVNTKEIPGNGVDDDRNGYVDDVYGYDFARMTPNVLDTSASVRHGTLTSGIIVGDGSGGIVTGVAPGARIMPLVGGGITAAALGYQYAIENGADVISMSFSIPNLGNIRGLWRMMSDHAVAAGVVLVGGAGNFRTSAQLPYQHQSPKDVPSVISVAGVDTLMSIVPFSSGGPAEWGTVALYRDYPMPAGLIKPDVVAFPGAGYPVLSNTADSGYVDPNTRIQGNSFSGPQGAGVAALMLSASLQLPAWRVKEILESTARHLGAPGKNNDFGAGLIDAFGAVREAKRAAR